MPSVLPNLEQEFSICRPYTGTLKTKKHIKFCFQVFRSSNRKKPGEENMRIPIGNLENWIPQRFYQYNPIYLLVLSSLSFYRLLVPILPHFHYLSRFGQLQHHSSFDYHNLHLTDLPNASLLSSSCLTNPLPFLKTYKFLSSHYFSEWLKLWS